MRDRIVLTVVIIFIIGAVFLGGFFVYNLPPVHQRLAWRLEVLRDSIKYALNPPEEAIFVPAEQVEPFVAATLQALTPTLTPSPSPTATAPEATPLPSATATVIPTPLPQIVRLEGIKYEDQHNRWNFCGPANLSMALTYWGWQGNRDVVGKSIKLSDKDKNVMPYEMEYFVDEQIDGISALVRSGGDIDLLKRMLSNGFPVIAEKGFYEYDYTGKLGWMGHYQFVTGYDQSKEVLVVQDTYNDGPDYEIPFTEFLDEWRPFNFVFLITYPQDRQDEVLALLGPWADPAWAISKSAEVAREEISALSGKDQFFAAFNLGTALVGLQQYYDAAVAFDNAFALYAALPDDWNRPFRMMWYQTSPYWAYFYSGRYGDVKNLATTTLEDTISEPVLEESLYWRGMAKAALGDTEGAIQDYRDSLKWHPEFAPSLEQLAYLGAAP